MTYAELMELVPKGGERTIQTVLNMLFEIGQKDPDKAAAMFAGAFKKLPRNDLYRCGELLRNVQEAIGRVESHLGLMSDDEFMERLSKPFPK